MRLGAYLTIFMLLWAQTANSNDGRSFSSDSPFDKAFWRSGAGGTGVPINLMKALCFVESGHKFNVRVFDTNGRYSLGVCQIQLRTAKDMGFTGKWRTLMLPEFNIFYAAKYLRHQYIKYGKNWERAVGAYNLGHWTAQRPNKKYVDKVLQVLQDIEMEDL